MQVLLAPKSVYTLPGVWQGSTAFSGFNDGCELLMGREGAEIKEELSECLRNMGEACDQLQGRWRTCACVCVPVHVCTCTCA